MLYNNFPYVSFKFKNLKGFLYVKYEIYFVNFTHTSLITTKRKATYISLRFWQFTIQSYNDTIYFQNLSALFFTLLVLSTSLYVVVSRNKFEHLKCIFFINVELHLRKLHESIYPNTLVLFPYIYKFLILPFK